MLYSSRGYSDKQVNRYSAGLRFPLVSLSGGVYLDKEITGCRLHRLLQFPADANDWDIKCGVIYDVYTGKNRKQLSG